MFITDKEKYIATKVFKDEETCIAVKKIFLDAISKTSDITAKEVLDAFMLIDSSIEEKAEKEDQKFINHEE